MDLEWCLHRLPKKIREALKESDGKLILAGGFIRSCISREEVKDIDFICDSKETAMKWTLKLTDRKPLETKNAYTIFDYFCSVQFVHRWTYTHPRQVIPSFDFTVAQAAIWFSGGQWNSHCHNDYYSDLAAKRLVYTNPNRDEDAGGSLLRVLKFYQRGYRIPLSSLADVLVRFTRNVRWGEINSDEQASKIFLGLLHEVDPSIALDGIPVD